MKRWRILLAEPDSGRCMCWINEFAKLPAVGGVRSLESLQDVPAFMAQDGLPFDAALLSAGGPGDGVVPAIRSIRRSQPACRVVVFAVPEGRGRAVELLEAGAWAVLSDRVTPRELEQCLASAARGEAVLTPAIAGDVLQRIRHLSLVRAHALPRAGSLQTLTRRERQILNLIARRLSNQEIARELVVEVGTVKNHVHSVLKKLGVASRHEAAAFGLEAVPAERAERVQA